MVIGFIFSAVDCGGHQASSCRDCLQGNGANWCNGDCVWCEQHNQCVAAGGSGNQSYKKTFSNTHFDELILLTKSKIGLKTMNKPST